MERTIEKDNSDFIEKIEKYLYDVLHKEYGTFFPKYGKDLFQSAVEGVLKAKKTYRPDRGAMTTYCAPFVRHEITAFIHKLQNTTEHYCKNES